MCNDTCWNDAYYKWQSNKGKLSHFYEVVCIIHSESDWWENDSSSNVFHAVESPLKNTILCEGFSTKKKLVLSGSIVHPERSLKWQKEAKNTTEQQNIRFNRSIPVLVRNKMPTESSHCWKWITEHQQNIFKDQILLLLTIQWNHWVDCSREQK